MFEVVPQGPDPIIEGGGSMKSDRTFWRGGFGLMEESEELGGVTYIPSKSGMSGVKGGAVEGCGWSG